MVTAAILRQRRAELTADLNAISGAIQQIDWTLERLEGGDNPPSEPSGDDGTLDEA